MIFAFILSATLIENFEEKKIEKLKLCKREKKGFEA